jgi:transcriptional regulator with XRE-family HTH domain
MARRTSPDSATIGDNIRLRRTARGWSVRHAADRAGIAHTTWSRIERGLLAADNRFTLAAIAEALECSATDLTDQPGAPADRESAEAQARVRAIRQALVDADLAEEATVQPRPIEQLHRELVLVADLRRRCDYAGVGQLLPRLLLELHAASFGTDRDAALALLVEAAFIASGVVRFAGSPAESWLAAERGRDAARALDDPVYIAFAEYERAHAATGCGSYARGLAIAGRAIDQLQPHLAVPNAMQVLGQLHLTCAFAAIGAKDPGQVPGRLEEARQLAEQTGQTDTLGLMFGPTNVRFWQVSMEVDGGEPGRAVELARDTNPAQVDSPSRQVAFYTDTARALAKTRNDDQAVRMLLTAERLAPPRVRASRLVQETTRILLERAQRRAGGAELRALCQRMGLAV